MTNYTFKPDAFAEASALLSNYYGIELLPSISRKDDTIVLETSLDIDGIRKIFEDLPGVSGNDPTVLDALILLSSYIKSNAPLLDEESFAKATKVYIRQDVLRLYLFCEENKCSYEGITIRGKKGSIRLHNSMNWLWKDLAGPYLEKNFPDILNAEDARKELLTGKRRRGRRPNDPRVPVLLWGTYKMLSDLHGFSSPMPNSLCNFIIQLLQIQDVFPNETEIDTLWVRAELRYIKSRPVKPRFPIKE